MHNIDTPIFAFQRWQATFLDSFCVPLFSVLLHQVILLLRLILATILVFLTPSGNVNVCLGEMRTFTCVSGAVLVWEYDGASNALFTSTDNTTRSLSSDIDVEFVSNAGGVLQVMAIVNVTSDINGKTLQCRNTALDTSNTESRNIIFNAQSNCMNVGLTTPLHYASVVLKPMYTVYVCLFIHNNHECTQ